ncbi:MAG: hypothetical protein A3J83_07195 [Elusimicrobia bacterium RIFOXYA2_FULL_40_6]|nr:MAG: hypothetical protein A3J83_07195 [Elusimicrobia bacterium RIFOXYA2_FULL_40_6]
MAESIKNSGFYKILIVDDDTNVIESVKEVLSMIEKKMVVETAQDGVIASMKIIDFLPDLVILDIGLPGQSGAGVCKLLKMNRNLGDTKVLVLSAYADRLKELLDLGADIALEKPVDAFVLEKEICKLLN